MFEELFNLLRHLGLGPAAQPVCDLIARLAGETMSLGHLRQEIENVLTHHGRAHLTGAVISTLVELGLAGFVSTEDGTEDATAPTHVPRGGSSPISDSVLLAGAGNAIAVNPQSTKAARDIARGWLDIDGGIYIDVGQHGAGSDSEK